MNDQHQRQPQPQYGPAESNGLGLAGFIVSLVGLVTTCGLISPIGLILSLVALGKRPKGFAIAGVVIGAIGSLWFIIGFFFIGIGALMALVGLGMAAAFLVAAQEIGPNAIDIYDDIESYHDANGRAPAQLVDMGTYQPAELQDAWGNPVRYEVSADGQEIWLRSDGEDGTQGTDDDIEFYRNFQTDEFRYESENFNFGK